jgi:CrcB protein
MTTTKPSASNTAILYTYVIVGSVIGGVGRYAASVFIPPVSGFPLATLFVNIVGSFIIGFYGTLSGPDGRLFASARQRQFVMTGVCGGFTTFSSFSLETVRLLQAGMTHTALLNISISVVTWLLSVWLGYAAASRLNRLKGS